VGIVVSGDQLDVGVGIDGPGWRASQDPSAVRLTAARMAEMRPIQVLIAATDSVAWPLVSELHAYRIPVVLLDADQVQHLARELGIDANKGQMDGHSLARLAQTAKLPTTTLPPKTVDRLSAFVARSQQLQDALENEKYNRLNTPYTGRAAIEERIIRLQQELDRLSAEIQEDFRARIASVLATSANQALARSAQRKGKWLRPLQGMPYQPPQRIRAAIFAVLALGTLALAGLYVRQTFFPPQPPVTVSRKIDIVGSMSGFDQTEIHLKLGQPVTVRLTSLDNPLHTDGGGRHQWAVEELGVNLIAPPDGSNTVTFTPEKAGRFAFYCDICCGGRANPTMNGTLIVEG
jgi:heme/copper-type cytochrome/quinol oxidase subunit 2